MCGPSTALKELNQKIQGFSTTMTSEAQQVFGTANGVVNKVLGAVNNIISGGPGQAGFSAAERNAMDAAAVNAGAAEARNLKGAAASGAAAVGGGNVPVSGGSGQAAILAAETKAASDTAAAKNEIVQKDFEQGNKNFWQATDTAERAPGILAVAEGFNKDAMSGLETAQKSQQEIDTASNWWQPLLEKGAMAGLGMATGGISNAVMGGVGNMSADSSFGENIGNFFKGAITPGGVGTPGPSGGSGGDSTGVDWSSFDSSGGN